MTEKAYKREAYARAERTVFMSLDEAGKLPGMLAPIVRGQLALYGYCPRIMEGKRTLIIRAD